MLLYGKEISLPHALDPRCVVTIPMSVKQLLSADVCIVHVTSIAVVYACGSMSALVLGACQP